jgi:hypothetical protein
VEAAALAWAKSAMVCSSRPVSALASLGPPLASSAFLRHVADSHGAGAVKQCRVVLGHLFGMAIQARALKSSPMKDVKRVLPAVPKDTPRDTSRAFTRAERDAVVTLAYELASEDGLNPRTARKRYAVADLVAFLAATGCRINEARELRWENVPSTAELSSSRAPRRQKPCVRSTLLHGPSNGCRLARTE